jgi:thioredoxin-like negative regulator of GroEL
MLQHLDTKNVINIARIDIDRHPRLFDQYHVLGVPLIVLTYRNAEIKRFGGSINYQEFKEWISTVEAFKELS